jgi:copper transport protein
VLVATPPGARPALNAGGEVVELAFTGAGRAQVRLDPPRVGLSTLSVAIRDGRGNPWDVPEVTATINLPKGGLGPLPVPLVKAGAGEYGSRDLRLPMTGQWRLELRVRTSDIDEQTLDTTVSVT